MSALLSYKPPTGGHVHIAAAAMLGITWVAVGLRIWARGIIQGSFGWDDITACITQAFFTIFCASIIKDFLIILNPGFMLSYKLVNDSINWLLVTSVFYVVTMVVFKISLAIFFLRIAVVRWHRLVVYGSVTLSTVFSFAYVFVVIFQCGYPSSGWTFLMNNLQGKCISNAAKLGTSYTHAVVVALTDWSFAILAMIIVKDLKMERRMKVISGFILILGTAGSICSVIRIRYIYRLTETQLGFFESAVDFAQWTILEPGIGIVANSLATLRPLLNAFLKIANRGKEDAKNNEQARAAISPASPAPKNMQSLPDSLMYSKISKSDVESHV